MWKYTFRGQTGTVTEEQYEKMRADVAFKAYRWAKVEKPATSAAVTAKEAQAPPPAMQAPPAGMGAANK